MRIKKRKNSEIAQFGLSAYKKYFINTTTLRESYIINIRGITQNIFYNKRTTFRYNFFEMKLSTAGWQATKNKRKAMLLPFWYYHSLWIKAYIFEMYHFAFMGTIYGYKIGGFPYSYMAFFI